MTRGGKRKGAGRPKNAKDKTTRSRSAKKSKKEIIQLAESGKGMTLYDTISKHLSPENRKLLKTLVPEFKTPLDCLTCFRDFLVAEYNFYTINEFEKNKESIEAAKLDLKELEENGTINGRAVAKGKIPRKKLALQKIINKKPTRNPTLNTLAQEIRQYNELIDRIANERQDQTVNIFNILKEKANPADTERLTKEMFDACPEIEDAEIIEEEEDVDNG